MAEVKEELRLTKEELRLTKEELRLTKEENEKLKLRILDLSHKKTSTNSSIPPSSDIQKTTKSLRQKSDKKSGGQPGRCRRELCRHDQRPAHAAGATGRPRQDSTRRRRHRTGFA